MRSIHRSGRAIAAALSMGLVSAATAHSGFVVPALAKGATPNRYNRFKGSTPEIERHNAAIGDRSGHSSKGRRKKQAAKDRKLINMRANGAAI